jgi:hypothetical protein
MRRRTPGKATTSDFGSFKERRKGAFGGSLEAPNVEKPTAHRTNRRSGRVLTVSREWKSLIAA